MAPDPEMICSLFASGANPIAKRFIKTEIDWLVYGLYGLIEEEIGVVEGKTGWLIGLKNGLISGIKE